MTNKFCVANIEGKKDPFIILLTDPNINGPYVEELIREIKKYPKLLMMTERNFAGATNWNNAHMGDCVVFGDAYVPFFNFDYRIEENESFLAETKIRPVYDLLKDRKEWKRAIKKYAKNNNKNIPKRPASTLRSCMVCESTIRNEDNLFKLFNNLFNPYGEKTHNITQRQKPIVLNIDEELLDEYDVNITIPKQQTFTWWTPPKKKVKKDNVIYYIVHQTWVKIGLKAYDIYVDSLNRRFIMVDGQKYWVSKGKLYNA